MLANCFNKSSNHANVGLMIMIRVQLVGSKYACTLSSDNMISTN